MESFAMDNIEKTDGQNNFSASGQNSDRHSVHEQRQRRGARQIVSSFFHYTTINGLQRLASAKTIIGRLFWIVVVFGALGMFSRDLYELVKQYYDRPVSIVSKLNYFRKMEFPAITVCNVNRIRNLDLGDIADLDNRIEKRNNNSCFKEGLRNEKKCDEDKDEHNEFSDEINYLLTNTNESVLKKSGHQLRQFVVSCRFGGIRCRNKKYWTQFWDPQYGNCYTFNSRIKGFDPKVSLFSTSEPGNSDGLKLVLNIELNKYIPEITQDAGVKLTVTQPNEMPFPLYQSVSLAPGFKTDISLKKVEIQRVDRFGNGSCRANKLLGEKNIYRVKYNVSYSVQACLHDCYSRSQIQECGCAEYAYLTATPSTKVCDETVANIEQCLKRWRDTAGSCRQSCVEPCVQTIYEPSISFTQWPSAISVEDVMESLGYDYALYNNSLENVRGNFLTTNIFFQRFRETKIEETLEYGTANLLADIGGQIGLWAGLSVISMCELIELVALLIRHCLRARREHSPGV